MHTIILTDPSQMGVDLDPITHARLRQRPRATPLTLPLTKQALDASLLGDHPTLLKMQASVQARALNGDAHWATASALLSFAASCSACAVVRVNYWQSHQSVTHLDWPPVGRSGRRAAGLSEPGRRPSA